MMTEGRAFSLCWPATSFGQTGSGP